MESQALAGKTALVTGAGKGIGEAIARELARLGARVVLAARTESDLKRVETAIQEAGGTALAAPTDVTSLPSVVRLIDRTREAFGGLDILVNNAGGLRLETVVDSTPNRWWEIVEQNLLSTYLCTYAALQLMLPSGGGHIVNVLSIAAQEPFQGMSAYCAAKAAAAMFTRVLAAEVREHGVRVTAIYPGATNTPLWKQMPDSPDPEQMLDPHSVARAVAFAVTQSEDASIDALTILPRLGIL